MAVYKKNNRWYIDYYAPDGKRIREVVHIKGVDPSRISPKDALDALSVRKAEMAQGKFDINKTKKHIRFEKLMQRYLDWAKRNHKSYDRDMTASKPLLSHFKGKAINNISKWHIDGYQVTRRSQGVKPATINKELGILKRMYNLALDGTFEGIKLSSNPIGKVKLLKTSNLIPRVYKTSEFTALYNSASEHFKPILLCAYMTGMRRGEIVKLKWKDVDLEDGYIIVTETKNNESRSIPIGGDLLDTINRLRQNSESEYVFTTDTGKPYASKSAWRRAWNTALRKSGISHGRFHDMRHTFVSTLIVDEKEDNATVMAISGHKDMRMLQRYSHTREEAKKSAISKLGNRLKSAAIDTYLDTSNTNQETMDTNVIALSQGN